VEQRITELEERISYQDMSIETLGEEVRRQQLELERLNQTIELLSQRLQSLGESPIAPESEETPPPHY